MSVAAEPFRVSVGVRRLGAPSVRACRAARLYGLDLESGEAAQPEVSLDLAPGTLTLLVGHSGAGKTTLLNACEREASGRLWRVIRPERVRLRTVPSVDQFPRDALDGAMRRLARAGLGEASCFVRRPKELSAGQRARLLLAVAMERAGRASGDALLLIDEFASGLDRLTARSLLTLLAREATSTGLRVLCAASDETLAHLAPPEATVLRIDAGRIERSEAAREGDPIAIDVRPPARDVRAAARWLGGLHYRSGRPASVVRTLLARERATGEILGMLTVAMPTLNGRVRDAAWPGRYSTGDRREDAAHLNDEVRRIARVIVDPRVRALGVATGLVEAYLANPETARTEAIAAMGRASGFFARAGMASIDLPPSPGDARLLDALRFAGLEAWRLATPRAAHRRAVATLSRRLGEREALGFLERELRVWANASRARRSALASASLEAMFTSACARCLEGAVGYVLDKEP
ncbi:MAG: ATP-binding cassette domain-containing protein [Phycisphaerales bacterium]